MGTLNEEEEGRSAEPLEFRLRGRLALDVRPARLTRAGLIQLEEELDTLEHERMPEIVQRIHAIREESADPVEGGELAGALEDLAQARARAAELRAMIASGEVVESGGEAGIVHLGSAVTLSTERHHERYVLVGAAEADPMGGRLSEESPLGRSLLGHHAGERVQWSAPDGVHRARILEVA